MPFRRLYTPYQRFMAKVDKQESGCWLWTGAVNEQGYGQFSLDCRNTLAHRCSCMLHKIPLQSWQSVYHTCLTRKCVNPEHLKVTTRAEIGSLHANRPPAKGLVRVRQRAGAGRSKRHRIYSWVTPKQARAIARAEKNKYKPHLCVNCRKVVSYFYTRRKYCSKPCRDKAYAGLRNPPRPCKRCGKTIVFSRNRSFKAMYCGQECLHAAQGEFLLFANPYRRQAMLAGGAKSSRSPQGTPPKIDRQARGIMPENQSQASHSLSQAVSGAGPAEGPGVGER